MPRAAPPVAAANGWDALVFCVCRGTSRVGRSEKLGAPGVGGDEEEENIDDFLETDADRAFIDDEGAEPAGDEAYGSDGDPDLGARPHAARLPASWHCCASCQCGCCQRLVDRLKSAWAGMLNGSLPALLYGSTRC